MEHVSVNTKMNFSFNVELKVIREAILSIQKKINTIKFDKNFLLLLNSPKTNVSISMNYKIKNIKDFAFETKRLIFLIEQKVFSLINTKPININLVFEGIINENQ
ncbi:MMB_0454 family protein [Mycoplasma struthionis]|uniref:Asp23/Gls24 family envelope stress response protein n=1 Tax=Mycoplasma struthionis TaxID=538220 RepID=A0A3G8LJI8_9MOLU|nr:hypothetical protein [Mycoplasma struthionis]AZG68808.1 hypothetical protein EGN60_02485 [Mycoplasma struthionis]TPI01582.1 hypothetical protein FJM01_02375 [Mycoplasma struthionis]